MSKRRLMEMRTILYTGILITLLLFTVNYSCAPGRYLRTEGVTPAEITGTYSLILYGGRHSNDIETVAILDREGDRYTFEVYASEYDYKIKKGIPAREALDEAQKFVRFHRNFWRSQLSRILDPAGNAMGYEVRPLYYPFNYRYTDVLYVDYRIKDDKVIVYIRLKPQVERMFFDDDRLFEHIDRPIEKKLK